MNEPFKLTEAERYKCALWLVSRNHILPTGLRKDKSIEEIDQMAWDTVGCLMEKIDWDKMAIKHECRQRKLEEEK